MEYSLFSHLALHLVREFDCLQFYFKKFFTYSTELNIIELSDFMTTIDVKNSNS